MRTLSANVPPADGLVWSVRIEEESDPAPNLNSPSVCLPICGLAYVVFQAVPPASNLICP